MKIGRFIAIISVLSLGVVSCATTQSGPVSSVDQKAQLEFMSVKFFEGGSTAPAPESDNQFRTDFPRSTARYIHFMVTAKNLLYRNRGQKPLIIGRYYYPDGTFFGEAKIDTVEVPASWNTAELWTGWGWDKAGNWTLGTYRVEILFGNTKVGEEKFSIF
ncbi:MAG: hypothetical protein ACE144_07875 [Thermodesulfobacteriota bacterium]